MLRLPPPASIKKYEGSPARLLSKPAGNYTIAITESKGAQPTKSAPFAMNFPKKL